jgi:3-phenylpropionate/trans-cinnamate dioxygenase ferredoxin component
MTKQIRVTTVKDLPPGQAAAFDVEGKRIAVFNVAGTFFALDDTCPHAGASLATGYVEGGKVGCPWHGADFDLRTGAVLCPPARGNVASYRVIVEGDEVKVEL